ncbi:hypothetical protein [Streptomyces sp. NPDC048428]|uniref:hypothetical protein n=1 Tax=Streptomyces sp. NPDC048428 TaxID=3154503 RepID=UPI00343F52ED
MEGQQALACPVGVMDEDEQRYLEQGFEVGFDLVGAACAYGVVGHREEADDAVFGAGGLVSVETAQVRPGVFWTRPSAYAYWRHAV